MKEFDERDAKKEKERIGWRERLCRELDLVPDVCAGESLIEIRSSRLLTLWGGGRLLVYTPEQICVAMKRGRISVVGERLICTAYHVDAIEIEGRISSVCFEEV